MRTETIGLDYGVGYLDPDRHDPNIIYSEDYPDDDEWYDEYYLEAKYLDEEED